MRLLCVVLCVSLVSIEQVNTNNSILDLAQEDMLLFWRRSNAPMCKPFTVFKINCNHCVCGADGHSSCTRMDCNFRGPLRSPRTKSKTSTPEYYTEETDESKK